MVPALGAGAGTILGGANPVLAQGFAESGVFAAALAIVAIASAAAHALRGRAIPVRDLALAGWCVLHLTAALIVAVQR